MRLVTARIGGCNVLVLPAMFRLRSPEGSSAVWGMPYDPARHHRRSIRLRGYDYRQPGAYFVTVCTHRRQRLFGDVVRGVMRLNRWGRVVWDEWHRSATIRPEIRLDAFAVMPDHVHGIVIVAGGRGAQPCAPTAGPCAPTAGSSTPAVIPLRPPRSIPSFIAGFKSAVTARINTVRGTPGVQVWQRNYYEHIIRDRAALERIRWYIASNPRRWQPMTAWPTNDVT